MFPYQGLLGLAAGFGFGQRKTFCTLCFAWFKAQQDSPLVILFVVGAKASFDAFASIGSRVPWGSGSPMAQC